jgi:hypothetical protein
MMARIRPEADASEKSAFGQKLTRKSPASLTLVTSSIEIV